MVHEIVFAMNLVKVIWYVVERGEEQLSLYGDSLEFSRRFDHIAWRCLSSIEVKSWRDWSRTSSTSHCQCTIDSFPRITLSIWSTSYRLNRNHFPIRWTSAPRFYQQLSCVLSSYRYCRESSSRSFLGFWILKIFCFRYDNVWYNTNNYLILRHLPMMVKPMHQRLPSQFKSLSFGNP